MPEKEDKGGEEAAAAAAVSLNITAAATEIHVNPEVAALLSQQRRRTENGREGLEMFSHHPPTDFDKSLITHCGISRLSAGSDARLMLLMHEYVATCFCWQ